MFWKMQSTKSENHRSQDGIDREQFDSVEYGRMLGRMLQDCVRRKSVREGKQIHAQIIQNQEEANVFLWNNLVNMYAKCGKLADARQVFDGMSERNIVSWNVMLSAYMQNGYWEDALKLVSLMHDAKIKPGEFLCSSLLKVCAGTRNPVQGKALHGMAIKAGFVPNEYVEIFLVDMYSKCILLIDAHRVFDKMPKLNIVSWNAMLSAYIQNGYWEDALQLFDSMHDAKIKPDEFICSSLLKACAGTRNLIQGKALHGMSIKAGFVPYEYVEIALIDMYGKCNLLMNARRVFEEVSEPDVVSWTTIIRSYAENKCEEEAIKLFSQMQWSSSRANDMTITTVLTACAQVEDLQMGKQMHGYIIKYLPDLNVWVENCLITMYCNCGDTEYAFKVFERMSKKDVVSWTAMMAGGIRHGHL